LAFALSGGALLLAAVAAIVDGVEASRAVLVVLGALALVLWPLKWRYWRDIDGTPLAQQRGDAVGLPDRTVRRFEGPTTEANYITKEMGFVLARRHAKTLRIVAVVLFALVPAGCLAMVGAVGGGAAWLAVAAVSAVAGAF